MRLDLVEALSAPADRRGAYSYMCAGTTKWWLSVILRSLVG